MVYKLSKMTKLKVLARSRSIASSLPSTRILTKRSLWHLLSRYKKIIIKPTGGSGGKGVFQVSLASRNTCKFHYGSSRKTIIGKNAAYSYIRNKTKGRPHIAQQKIALAQVRRRPFDMRVMVQRRRGSRRWLITGKLAKIAGPGYIITNTARSHGRVTSVTKAIRRSNIRHKGVKSIHRRINRISKRCVRKLHSHYPRLRMVGLDIGLDRNGKPWVIEANFKPSKSLFLKLKNKSYYRRILRYSR